MSNSILISAIGVVIVMVVHAVAIAYWGGRIAQRVTSFDAALTELRQSHKEHDERIRLLETISARLTEISERFGRMET